MEEEFLSTEFEVPIQDESEPVQVPIMLAERILLQKASQTNISENNIKLSTFISKRSIN
jgi:hypothetical protein